MSPDSSGKRPLDDVGHGSVKSAKVECATKESGTESRRTAPSFRIHYASDGPTEGPHKVLVGELVKLKLIPVDDAEIASPAWDISGTCVGGYDGMPSGNIPTTILKSSCQPIRKEGLSVFFHWTSPGKESVRATADLNEVPGSLPTNNGVRFEVVSPRVLTATAKVYRKPAIRGTPEGPELKLLGEKPGDPGAEFDFSIDKNSSELGRSITGKIAGIQLVKTNDYWIADISETPGGHNYRIGDFRVPPEAPPPEGEKYMKEYLSSTQGRFYLDDKAPYGAAKSTSSRWKAKDSPGTPVHDSLVKLAIDESFVMYYMFKSATRGSIWVSLMKCEWQVNRVITRDPASAGKAWPVDDLNDGSYGGFDDHNATPCYDLPIWEGRAEGRSIHFACYTKDPESD